MLDNIAHSTEHKNIAVLISDLRYECQRKVLVGLLEEAEENGSWLTIFSCDTWQYSGNDYQDGEANICKLINFDRYDGIICKGDIFGYSRVRDMFLKKFFLSGIPGISIGMPIEGMSYVHNDNYSGIKELTEHLVTEHGAKNIAIVSGPKISFESRERIKAVTQVLSLHSLSIQDQYVAPGDWHGGYNLNNAVRVVQRWIDLGKKQYAGRWKEYFPDTIICLNDEMAIGAISALEKAGLSVPEDVRVTGYDNSPESQVSIPGITTVDEDDIRLGRCAMRELSFMIDSRSGASDIAVPCHPVIRQSCGCPETNNSPWITNASLKKNYANSRKDLVFLTGALNHITVDFSTAKSNEDLFAKIKKSVLLQGYDTFVLCLSKSPFKDISGFGDSESDFKRCVDDYGGTMTVPVAMLKGKSVDIDEFPTDKLIPEKLRGKGVNSFLVMPLHFQKLCFGYVLIGLNKDYIIDNLTSLMIKNIANALENIRKIRELSNIVERLNKLYIFDSLTGVLNRSGFEQRAKKALESKNAKRSGAVIFFADLDDLKYVNDHFGHERGDIYICDIAHIISQNLRDSDVLMRYGGDEFVALCPGMPSQVASKKVITLENAVECRNAERRSDDILGVKYGLSIGYIVITPQEIGAGIDLDVKIEEADHQMYLAKKVRKTSSAVLE